MTVLLPAMHVAYAQDQNTAEREQSGQIEEIVVSGTRVVRDGFESPTPVTVIGVEQIETQATTNIADYVNTLPSFSGSTTPESSTLGASNGSAGINTLNLRGLGSIRTLVLLDGQRIVGATVEGIPDINIIPQQLVERVDVVTGGASAAYGSDAVAGVVNFVLNRDFSGIKATASTGATTGGDNRNSLVSLTGGMPFADGRGHFLLSGEYTEKDGLGGGERDWNLRGWQVMVNPDYTPDNGQPERLLLDRVTNSTTTPGGLINRGPLTGTAFGAGGAPRQFEYGDLVSGDSMRGGEWRRQVEDFHIRGESIDPEATRQNVFTRVSYNLTDEIEVFGQYSWSENDSLSSCCTQMFPRGITVGLDNAFMPPDIATQLAMAGESSARIGTSFGDLSSVITDYTRRINRAVLGIDGEFDAFGNIWNWDAYYQSGRTEIRNRLPGMMRVDKMFEAVDAVIDPATGDPVCRSTLTDPGNGCVPFNLFGTDVNNQSQIDHITGVPFRNETVEQDVFATSIQGEPFSNWAGPVSLAAGMEYREESVTAVTDEPSRDRAWYVGNFQPTIGSYNVSEGFLETVVPLGSELKFAYAWDFNAALRFTDYSTSGSVTTWKVGTSYSPIPDVRFRITRSRDIRSANLSEFFAPGDSRQNSLIDPENDENVQFIEVTSGNLNLRPEEADTTGIGIVLQPSLLPGFSASVDYWSIELKDAIDNVSPQNVVDLCFQGNQEFCAAISRENIGGVERLTEVRVSPFNLVERIARGWDIEASYQLPESLWGGDLSLRVLATHYTRDYENDGITPPRDGLGENAGSGPPDWRWRGSAAYDNGPWHATLALRGVSSGVYNNNFIQCNSACPTSTVNNRTINDNHIPGATYLDLAISYTLYLGRDDRKELQAFLNIRNLTNKDPAIAAPGPGAFPWDQTVNNPVLYDAQGRVFLAGVRLRMF